METLSAPQFALTMSDGLSVAAYRSMPICRPRGIVQIALGLSEPFGRFEVLTERLNNAGYAVYANDHRTVAGAHRPGDFGAQDFQSLLNDMAALTRVAKGEVPGRPVVLVGHGIGALVAQLYLLEHSRSLGGLVLARAGSLDGHITHLVPGGGLRIPEVMIRGLEPALTRPDASTLDRNKIGARARDPLRTLGITKQPFASVFEINCNWLDSGNLSNVRDDIPVCVISNENDRIGKTRQTFAEALVNCYGAAGLWNVDHRRYRGDRHGIFEYCVVNRIYDDLISWIGRLDWPASGGVFLGEGRMARGA